jgi:LCP family protein required for cell wall assembly
MMNNKYNDETDENTSGKRRSGRSQAKAKRQKSMVAIFFTVLSTILGVYCVFVLAFFAYTYFNDNPDDDGDITAVTDLSGESGKNPIADLIAQKPKLAERTNFAILGTDEDGTRTDTILVGCYNSVTNGLTLISVPRDTIVTVDEEMYEKMNEEYPEPGQKTMKINAIHHYGGDTYGVDLILEELEKIFDIKIDYYVKVDFDAFDYLIDSIGGVEYDVPMNMDYDDPGQDLAIHLKAGKQMLNGEQAEGLVRFRYGYANGDIGRIETQQGFIKELMRQVLDKDTIFSNASAYVTTFFKYIDTNVKLSDGIKYMSVIKDFDADKLTTYTLPGLNVVPLISGGYTMDEEATEELAYNVFQKSSMQILAEEKEEEATEEAEKAEKAVSKDCSIQVLNGGFKNGAASDMKADIEEEGYTVKSIGSFTGSKTVNDRIYVAREGIGTDLEEFLNNPELIVDPDFVSENGDYDIVIVIGTGDEE